MKNHGGRTALLLVSMVACICLSCRDKVKAPSGNSSHTGSNRPNLSNGRARRADAPSQETTPKHKLDDYNSVLGSYFNGPKPSNDAFRQMLEEYAQAHKVTPKELASSILSTSQSPVELKRNLSALDYAFTDSGFWADVVIDLPPGDARSLCVSAMKHINSDKDLASNKRIYNELKPGKDRTIIASSLAAYKFRDGYFDQVIPFLDSIEFPEEKYISLEVIARRIAKERATNPSRVSQELMDSIIDYAGTIDETRKNAIRVALSSYKEIPQERFPRK